MFTYLNPKIRQKLIKSEKLIRINAQGQNIDPELPAESGSLSLNIIGPIPLPLNIGNTKLQVLWYAAVRTTELYQVESLANQLRETGEQNLFSKLASSMAVNSVLIVGDPHKSESPLVRVHSSCLTGDVFYSQRCECGPQLAHAMDRMNEEDNGGYLIYMAGHEGRGIGLWAKAATYLLQDEGENTYQANKSLGLDEDCRDFSDAAALLHYFVEDRPIRLLTNNPKKVNDLKSFGLKHITPTKHLAGITQSNKEYLKAKRDWGHLIGDDEIELLDQ